jgi:hypothetical protein
MVLAMANVATAASLPDNTIPNGWGVQLKGHCNKAEDLDNVKALGLKVVRHGFHWAAIEKEKGVYDYGDYQRIADDCKARGLKLVGCIAFGNDKLYGPVREAAGREAYAKYAAALAEHFKDYDIMWEIWNEPNTMTFWGKHGGKGNSEPYAEEYYNLVKATVPAMRAANPNCIILAGSVSNMWTESYKWMDFIFADGILKEKIDGWSVHPYGVKSPEDYIEAYKITRDMMAKHGGNPELPMINTERGFPLGKLEGFAGGDDEKLEKQQEYQSWHVVRQYLIDLYLNVNGTVWYEWVGKDKEASFSLYNEKPTPAFNATKVLLEQLTGYKIDKRIETKEPRDFVIRFVHPTKEPKIVAWTAPPPMQAPDKVVNHAITVDVGVSGELTTHDLLGKPGKITATNGSIELNLTGAPQYVTLTK